MQIILFQLKHFVFFNKVFIIKQYLQFKQCVHTVKVPRNKLIEMVIFDKGVIGKTSGHPMHLHGQSFAVVAMNRFVLRHLFICILLKCLIFLVMVYTYSLVF